MTDPGRLDGLLPRDEPARPIVMTIDREVSRGDLAAMADSVSAGLVDAGVEPGRAVAVRLGDGPELIAAVLGIWQAGAVHVPLNPRATSAEIVRIVERVRPGWRIDPDGITTLDGVPATYDTDVALITFTSGTTGPPEPVLQRHSGVLEMFEPVLASLGAKPGPRKEPMPNLIPVPLSLWAGLYNVLFAFRVGAPAVLMGRFDPGEFATLVARYGIRSTVLPPAAMVRLCDSEAVESLVPLRYVRSITAPLSPLQARRFRDRFGIAVLNSYGQTEFGGEIVGWSAADARTHGETHLGAAGRPHKGVSLRIEDDELVVRTPAIDRAIAAGTDLADRLTPDGWFRSGDLARIDEEGFVWIEGRRSDAINRGGLKVHPGEVEEVLRLLPGVADAAVVGVPDDRVGEVPHGFLVVVGERPSDTTLEAHCREHLVPYKVPVRFSVVPELPRNEMGKVLRRELRPGDHS